MAKDIDRDKVDNVAMELRTDASYRDVALQQMTQLLTEIRDQTEALSQLSNDYNVKLQNSMDGIRDENEQNKDGKQHSMKLVENSQAHPAESLTFHSQQIEYQRQQSETQGDATQWTQLQDEAQTQTTSLSNMQKTTSESLKRAGQGRAGQGRAGQMLQDLAALDSGNSRFATTSNKVVGLSDTFDGFGKLGGLLSGFGGKKSNETTISNQQTPKGPEGPRMATNPSSVYTGKHPIPRERAPLTEFPPPPKHLPPLQQNENYNNRNGGLSTPRLVAPLIEAMPPPLPPRSVSGPILGPVSESVSLADEAIEDRPSVPSRPRQQPADPRNWPNLSPTSSELAPDTNQSSSKVLAQHGRSTSSPNVPMKDGGPSIALQLVAGDSKQSRQRLPPASSMPSPGLGKSSPSASSAGSSPRTPTSHVGSVSPYPSKEVDALSCAVVGDLDTMSFAEKRKRIQGFYTQVVA